jgi:hypothetical protein
VTYETEDGEVLSTSTWDEEGPDTIHDVLTQLGTTNPAAVKALMKTPQWNDFSLALRRDVEAWLADHPTP